MACGVRTHQTREIKSLSVIVFSEGWWRVGHHGGCCQPFRLQGIDKHCGLVVDYDLRRNAQGIVPGDRQHPANKVTKRSLLALEPLVQQPPCQISHYVASSGQQHHWGMTCGCGSGSGISRMGVGGDNSYNRQICTSIDYGCCLCLTAAMEPHSCHQSIQQSTNILCNWTALLKLEKNHY